jgi:hypothetical protein
VLIFHSNLCDFFCLFISVYFIAFFDIIRDLFMCCLEVCRYFELHVFSGVSQVFQGSYLHVTALSKGAFTLTRFIICIS